VRRRARMRIVKINDLRKESPLLATRKKREFRSKEQIWESTATFLRLISCTREREKEKDL
jgi:hypothetical protein